MARAIDMAVESVRQGGGPFAALVVKDGEVLASGTNRVTASLDPTAHAEIVAIRQACHVLGDFQLTGCEIYASCEPCPMCLGAIYWARPARVFFAATHADAAAAGFDDRLIYSELRKPLPQRRIPLLPLLGEQAQRPFQAWQAKPNKRLY
jgi:guanine deaminase